jgi:hypothetical protein
VAVLLAQVGDVGGGGLEDPQAEEPEHGDQGKVSPVLPGRLSSVIDVASPPLGRHQPPS